MGDNHKKHTLHYIWLPYAYFNLFYFYALNLIKGQELVFIAYTLRYN